MKKETIKSKELDHYGDCPSCKKNWDGGDIPEDIRQYYSAPFKWSKLIGLETPGFDGISIWVCPFCKTKWDRFTGETIK